MLGLIVSKLLMPCMGGLSKLNLSKFNAKLLVLFAHQPFFV